MVHQNQSFDVSLPLNTNGAVQKMEPLNNLQVAVKNNFDVFYFSALVPTHILFLEQGEMDRKVFLTTWKDIPSTHEKSFALENLGSIPNINTNTIIEKLKANNVFMIAKRTVEGKDMVYLSLQLPRDIWVLMELKVTPGVTAMYNMAYKCRQVQVSPIIHSSIDTICRN
uniref:Beta-adaptin appendage C-terminal subdomain domain-containing protein n=1 Tax=Ciona savignyi TaxID=51511 RepID=H2ZG85_CIOSA